MSITQVEEIACIFLKRGIAVQSTVHTFSTTGDKDLLTSLRDLGKTDFFTKEIDDALLAKQFDLAIHAAKDLPETLPKGLSLLYMTDSIDPRDALVIKPGYVAKQNPVVGVSSERREKMVTRVWRDAVFKDIRGTVPHRLSLLDKGEYDAVVVAEAALLRLGLEGRQRIYLPGETAEHQGRLALLCRTEELDSFTRILKLPSEVVV